MYRILLPNRRRGRPSSDHGSAKVFPRRKDAGTEEATLALMSVFHRRMRKRKWTRERFQVAAGQFSPDDVLKYWSWLPVSSLIVGAASQLYLSLPESVFLRASDCLHLVTRCIKGSRKSARSIATSKRRCRHLV
jgi:hypothetical protein